MLFSALFLLSGCVSVSTLQDAETVKKGEMSHTLALGNISGEVDGEGASGLPGDVAEEIAIPMVEYMFRYGFYDNMDFGLKYSGSSYGADWKWNLMNDKFALAVGLGFAISEYEISSGSTDSKYSTTDLYIPLYLHYNLNENFRGYLVPKYVNRSVNTNATGVENSTTGLTGATVGVKFKRVFVEYTTLSGESENNNEDIAVNQFALGVVF